MQVSTVLNEELAEVMGAFIGDGCMSRYYAAGSDSWKEVVMFTGGWEKDSPYYRDVIGAYVEQSLGVKCRLYHRKDDNTVIFRSYDKKLIEFFLELGFYFGPKSGSVRVPDVVFSDRDLMRGCVRGIFNTDGSVYRRYGKRYGRHARHYDEYKVIQFKSKSMILMKQVRYMLTSLGFTPNRLSTDGKCSVCRLTSQKDVERFTREINTTHGYHVMRGK